MTNKNKGASGMAEARRRAGILDRYVLIERPTAQDAASFAAELGLAVDSLLRLATLWKRHRSEALLLGQKTALASGAGAPREAVLAEEIDLGRVRQERRAEILRRIRIMQRHVLETEKGGGDAVAAASEVGVSPEHFTAMLRKLKLHGRAETLPGATHRGTVWRRQPERARRIELLASMASKADPKRSLRSVYRDFAEACLSESLKPISLQRFYAIVQEMRSGAGRSSAIADEPPTKP